MQSENARITNQERQRRAEEASRADLARRRRLAQERVARIAAKDQARLDEATDKRKVVGP